MRPPRRRTPNPDYRPPREYLRGGLCSQDGRIRPELLAERAIATARELMILGEPLEPLERALQELALIARLAGDWPSCKQRLQALGASPAYARYPLIAQLLGAGAQAARQRADLQAFQLHLKRILTLVRLEAVLGGATVLEKEASERRRGQRARQVGQGRRRRGPNG